METNEQQKRHFFELGQPAQEVTVLYGDKEIARTTHALLLKEIGKSVYDPVYYIPREDVHMEMFEKNTNSSVCPIKGEAAYYDLKDDGNTVRNLAWSYETPLPRSKRIKDYLAFYSNQVTFVLKPIMN
jgi:uncharacterized protein (DUF427 family)